MLRIVHERASGEHLEVEVAVARADATIADLAKGLDGDAEVEGLAVDGRFVAGAVPLAEAGLPAGSVVRAATGPLASIPIASASDGSGGQIDQANRRAACGARLWFDRSLVVEIAGGLDAGHRLSLHHEEATVGRNSGCAVKLASATVSRRHAAILLGRDGGVAVADLGSRNGTWVDGAPIPTGKPVRLSAGSIARLGSVEIAVGPDRHDDRPATDAWARPGPTGRSSFNRPPRVARQPADPPLAVPEPPKTSSGRTAIGIATILTPLALAAVMVVVLGNPAFALFAVFSPVMAIAGAVEQRHRGKRTSRRDTARYRSDLRSLDHALAVAAESERTRRRAAAPDLAEVMRRATLPSVRLWERRRADDDFLLVRLGTGAVRWEPPLDEKPIPRPDGLAALLDSHRDLVAAPITATLAGGGVIGICGERPASLAVARSIVCQIATHQGPADVAIAVATSAGNGYAWDWAKWLPHVDAAPLADRVRSDGDPDLVVVVDDEQALDLRSGAVRSALRGGAASAIVVASSRDRLPASCVAVVDLHGEDGEATVHLPGRGEVIRRVLATGCSDQTARRCARALARFDDPERAIAGAGLPDEVRLLPLLGLATDDGLVDRLCDRWQRAGVDPPLLTTLGSTDDGPFVLDLVRDGPHGLIAGTTGSGKSELLRTFVAGLAASASPQHLTFVLIDFKGGSAFDRCAALPHTVGVVTDLDAHLGERALRCLEAELRYRERRLRAAGATDLTELRRMGGDEAEALPRLVVVIDEFATLKNELPGFVDSLVGIAQRGRSLGVHLVLATQRPSGAVSENIRTNTNLRIALRVQDSSDSTDVVGSGIAATLPRFVPGRAVVRLGPGELVPLQTALSTAEVRSEADPPIVVTPFALPTGERRTDGTVGPLLTSRRDRPGKTELDVLVAAAEEAWRRAGGTPPRRPWPDPLPTGVNLTALLEATAADDDGVAIGLADDPDHQRWVAHSWRPSDGNLLVYGIVGSGTSTALAAIALSLASQRSPDDVHLYVLSFGAAELAPLAELPHAGAVVTATERERQARLMRQLRAELNRRRTDAAATLAAPKIVLLLDGYSAFAAEFNDVAGIRVLEDLTRLFADGPDVGIHVVLAADRIGAVPMALAGLARQRLLLRLADPNDYALAGIGRSSGAGTLPMMVPGRAIDVASGRVVQIARPPGALAGAVADVASRWTGIDARPPEPVRTLPECVPIDAVVEACSLDARPWRVPLGIGERALTPRGFVLHEGDHALIAGPARSGRSTALAAIGEVIARARPDALVIAVAGRRSAVDLAEAVSTVRGHRGPAFLLVDDAESVEDPDGSLADLLAADSGEIAVIAAGRADALRPAYQHWTRLLRRSRTGLFLCPNVDVDGDLVGQPLPRRSPVALSAGRGWLVADGDAEVIHVADVSA